jgi:hypothetical protein
MFTFKPTRAVLYSKEKMGSDAPKLEKTQAKEKEVELSTEASDKVGVPINEEIAGAGGYGDVPRAGEGYGDVPRAGEGYGDVPRAGEGYGDVPRAGEGYGDVPRAGEGYGDVPRAGG